MNPIVSTLCTILNSNTVKVRKLMKQTGGYKVLLDEVCSMRATNETRCMVLETFLKLSSHKVYCKDWKDMPYMIDSFYEIYMGFNEHKNIILQICINISSYIHRTDVEDLILPMLSVHKLSDQTAILLFRKLLLSSNITEKWLHKNKWLFDELHDYLNDGNIVSILETIFSCTQYKYQSRISNILRAGIWKSKCREKIFQNTLNSNPEISSYSQSVLLDCLRYVSSGLQFKMDLSEQEKQNLITCAQYDYTKYFAIQTLHILSTLDISFLSITTMIDLSVTLQHSHTVMGNRIIIFETLMNYLVHATESIYEMAYEPIYKVMKRHNYIVRTKEYTYDNLEWTRKFYNVCKLISLEDHFLKVVEDKLVELQKNKAIEDKLNKNGIVWEYPNEFKCPITQDVMKDPVVASDGHSYERDALMSFLYKGNGKSPLTRETLNNKIIVTNVNLKKRIRDYAENICEIVEKVPKR